MFANGLADRSLIPARVIPKTQKIVLDASLPYTLYYNVGTNNKWTNPEKRVLLSPTPLCSNYWKEILWLTLDNSGPPYSLTYFYLIQITVVWFQVCMSSTDMFWIEFLWFQVTISIY